MRMRTVAGVMAALGLVAGCGGQGGASSPAPATEAPATTAMTPTPTQSLLTEEQLKGALLTVKDVPPGFAVEKDQTNKNKMFCDYKPPVEEKIRTIRTFIKGGGLGAELLSVALRQYGSAQEARAAFDAMTKALETCTTDTVNGRKTEYAVMSAPKIGDDSIGVRVTFDQGTVLQNFGLVGPTLVAVGTGGVMNANAELGSQTLEQQVKKYQEAAQSR